LRRQFREALAQQQDINGMAERLSKALQPEQKVMLGVQLYDLIARSDQVQNQMPEFYAFMDRMGMAAGVSLTSRDMLRSLIGHERHHIRVLKERYGLA
jgi:hypothetical protein